MTDISRERLLLWIERAEAIVHRDPQALAAVALQGLRNSVESGSLDLPVPARRPVADTQPQTFPARGPDTSFEAAALHTGAKVREKYLAIYGVVEASALGLTDDDIASALPVWNRDTVRNRRVALSQAGWLRDSGRRRAGNSGSPMIVWEAQP